jgi:hypothetical protein
VIRLGRVLALASIAVVALCACGKSESECNETRQRCDRISNDIKQAAAARGIAAEGVCTSSEEQVQKDFGRACAEQKACNDELDGC